MSTWTHMATGILLVVPAISLVIAVRTLGAVKPAYLVADARRSMRTADAANVAPSFNCESRGISR
jgi:hypothetical protein